MIKNRKRSWGKRSLHFREAPFEADRVDVTEPKRSIADWTPKWFHKYIANPSAHQHWLSYTSLFMCRELVHSAVYAVAALFPCTNDNSGEYFRAFWESTFEVGKQLLVQTIRLAVRLPRWDLMQNHHVDPSSHRDRTHVEHFPSLVPAFPDERRLTLHFGWSIQVGHILGGGLGDPHLEIRRTGRDLPR